MYRLGLAAVVAAASFMVGLPAGAQSSVDGTYNGAYTMTADRTRTGSFHCQGGPLRVVVSGGQLNWKIPQLGGLPTEVRIPVSGDGSFKLSQGDYQVSGRIAGGHFTADSESHYCGFHFDATKQP
ncbi:MAG TPA: hypothetical protein VKI44_39030 [Acetobacteraceae bacterium]|nr:hypothetical protein [Acetobacteraceae bacterium]